MAGGGGDDGMGGGDVSERDQMYQAANDDRRTAEAAGAVLAAVNGFSDIGRALADGMRAAVAGLIDLLAGFDIFFPLPADTRTYRLGGGWVSWYDGRWRACERRDGAWWWA